MASGMTNRAKADMGQAYLNSLTAPKLMLLRPSYAFDPDQGFVAALQTHELVATNYAGGYGGAGRRAATGLVVVRDDVEDRAEIKCDDATWPTLGGAVNDTVGYVALIDESGGSDATARAVCVWDVANTPTNGGNFTVDFDSLDGNLRIA